MAIQTLFLTDQPETAHLFLPPGRSFQPLAPAADPVLAEVWKVFGFGAPGWLATSGSSKSGGVVVIIDDAPASQFDRALRALKVGVALPDRLVCIALCGRGFRGQRQRAWEALRGNLHLSAHYRIDVSAASVQAALTMIPSVIAAEAAEALSGGRLRPGIKWVNDVLLDRRKVSGVLTGTQVLGGRVTNVVFGIGMNIDQAPILTPSLFVPEATCLAECDPTCGGCLPAALVEVAGRLDQEVMALREGIDTGLFDRYRNRVMFMGQTVGIWSEECDDATAEPPRYQGVVRHLNPDLSLALDGHDQPVRSGRLALLDGLAS